MHLIDTSTAENGKFVNGNANQGIKGTQVSSDWLNMVQGELKSCLDSASITPNKEDNSQVVAAIKKIVTNCMTPIQASSTLTPSTTWSNIGNKFEMQNGSLVDVTICVFVSTPTNDTLVVKTKTDGTNQRASFDLSVKGYQSKRLCFNVAADINDFFAEYTFVNASAGFIGTLYINGYITKF